jgi:hypothetical protein
LHNIIFNIRFKARKNDAKRKPGTVFLELALGNGAHGADSGAGTAVDAGTGIDHILSVALGNGAHGAGIHTGAAADAGITDNISHG